MKSPKVLTKAALTVRIERKGDSLLIIQWNDGLVSEYNVYSLRLNCPCATCVHEWTGDKILDEASVDPNIHPARIYSVGRYAMGLNWTDGHVTGLYSYDSLRRLDGKKDFVVLES